MEEENKLLRRRLLHPKEEDETVRGGGGVRACDCMPDVEQCDGGDEDMGGEAEEFHAIAQ